MYEPLREEIHEVIERVLMSGNLINGDETKAFEEEFAHSVGAKYCIGVTSGTTALHLALIGLGIGPGDEVITVSNTCAPTVSAIILSGATPVLIDVNENDLLMDASLVESAITSKTKAIIPVHLWGQIVDLESLQKTIRNSNIHVIEDCAQSQGGYYQNKHTGTIGDVGCFSFYPTKNLGAYGDAGAIVTNDEVVANRIRIQREYGYKTSNFSEVVGINGRISEIQAAILRIKLKHLNNWIKLRNNNASHYLNNIKSNSILLPITFSERVNAYHQFVIRCKNRDLVVSEFTKNKIEFGIHYPYPLHQMPPFKIFRAQQSLPISENAAKEILSIPVHESLNEDELIKIVEVINNVQ